MMSAKKRLEKLSVKLAPARTTDYFELDIDDEDDDLIWLADAIESYLSGESPSIEHALGIKD